MRVIGDYVPDKISIIDSPVKEGYVEVKIRENVEPYSHEDEETYSGYQYDEYQFTVSKRDDLEKDIEENWSTWVESGKTQELNPMATMYLTARMDAIDEYTEQLIEEGIL